MFFDKLCQSSAYNENNTLDISTNNNVDNILMKGLITFKFDVQEASL